jgi:putative tricarboxylic transport membrane protein
MIRSAKDLWAGILYIVVGAGATLMARDFGVGTAVRMGAGYFPIVLGVVLVILGLVAVIRAFIGRGTTLGSFALRALFLVVVSVLLFGLIVRGAGLTVALPLLVIVSAMASNQFRWIPTIALAAGLTFFCALVFIKGLGVPLPLIGAWFGR